MARSAALSARELHKVAEAGGRRHPIDRSDIGVTHLTARWGGANVEAS